MHPLDPAGHAPPGILQAPVLARRLGAVAPEEAAPVEASFRPANPPTATRVLYKPLTQTVSSSSMRVSPSAKSLAVEDDGSGALSSAALDQEDVGPFLTASPGAGSTPAELAASLAAREDVSWAAVDEVLHATRAIRVASVQPDDPDFAEQWGLEAIGAPAAWALGTGAPRSAERVTVCIVDSGIDYTHADLRANVAAAIGISVLADLSTPMDLLYHGTHVAGIIGAVGNNSLQVSGVTWANVSLLSCRFIDGTGFGYTSGAVTCVNYCVAQGARVIQNSWGGSARPNAALAEAIEAAARADALFVVSAGNNGLDLDAAAAYPASYAETYANVLAVASVGRAGNVSAFSNYGAGAVALAAPGENILSTVPGNGTAVYSGTSMAAPFVSGAAALALSLAGPGRLSALQLKTLLTDTADLTPALAGRVGAGMLRVDRVLEAALRHSSAAAPAA